MVAPSSIVNLFLFNPPKPKPYLFPSKIIRIQTLAGNEIAATYIKRQPKSNVTVIFSHGNAEDLNTCWWFMVRLSQVLDVNVIGYDYSGYGQSTGEPSESNCYKDIEAVYEYLLNVRNLRPEQIVLYGRSLGSGPSCYLASKEAPTRDIGYENEEGRSVAGLILHSPFTSVYRVVINVGFTMVGDKFPNIDRASSIRCPVFIIHGTNDEIVPIEHGKALHEAFTMEGGGTSFIPSNISGSCFDCDCSISAAPPPNVATTVAAVTTATAATTITTIPNDAVPPPPPCLTISSSCSESSSSSASSSSLTTVPTSPTMPLDFSFLTNNNNSKRPPTHRTEAIFVEGMGHNDYGLRIEAAIMERLNSFLDYHVLARQLWMKKTAAKSSSDKNRYSCKK